MSEPQVRFYRTPVDAPITGGFGANYGGYLHRGVDFGCPIGTPVRAPAAGTVVQPFNDGSFGVAVCLNHGDGWYTIYAHLSRADVQIGQRVPKGLQLGLSGNTGLSTGPHLHWQLSNSPQFPSDIARSRDPLRYVTNPNEEEPMTPEERAKLDAVYAALSGGVANVIEDWNANGNSLLLGYAAEQQKLAEHIANHAAGIHGKVPPHTHTPGGVA